MVSRNTAKLFVAGKQRRQSLKAYRSLPSARPTRVDRPLTLAKYGLEKVAAQREVDALMKSRTI
jgi:hypothetical protein